MKIPKTVFLFILLWGIIPGKNPMKKNDRSAKVYTITNPREVVLPNFENPDRVAEKNWNSLFWQYLPTSQNYGHSTEQTFPYSPSVYVQNNPMYYTEGYPRYQRLII